MKIAADTITDKLGRNEVEASPVYSSAQDTLSEDAYSLSLLKLWSPPVSIFINTSFPTLLLEVLAFHSVNTSMIVVSKQV